ncbi:SAM-dependent methyltransferase [Nocardia gamkensis]|uniref:SAM-dependent methyltransferase n=1 Tax=Nocardia gamkensis TaxID=352869 RepID=UPI0036E77555
MSPVTSVDVAVRRAIRLCASRIHGRGEVRVMGNVNLESDRPHPARMYDYFLGGTNNYDADRSAAKEILGVWPTIQVAARVNRAFMQRSTQFLASAGIRQFLDIGTGIPTEPNLHQIAQNLAPDARVVYVDNDPIVLAQSHALMASHPDGATAYLHADATDPDSVLRSPQLRDTIDLSQPVGLSLIALLHFIDGDATQLVSTYLDAFAPGSYVVICQVTGDYDPAQVAIVREIYRARGISARERNREEFTALFHDLELVDPGIVPPHRWRPNGITPPESHDAKVSCYAAVGRKL